MRPIWTPNLSGSAPRCCRVVTAKAGKGFKKPAPRPAPPKERKGGAGAGDGKVRRRQTQFIEDEDQQRQQSASRPANESPRPPQSAAAQREVSDRFRNAAQAQQSGEGGSDSDFERRLTALAEQTPAQRKADAERVQQDILALEPQFGRVPQAQQRAQQQARPVADDAEAAKPSWLVRGAAGAGALLLVGIFLVSSIRGDFGGAPPPAGDPAQQQQQLSEEQRKELEAQAKRFDEQLAAAPDSVEALEGAAVLYAKLGDLKKASGLLARLSKAKPDDTEVWRLLAETQSLQGDFRASAAAYETANAKAGGSSIDLLSSWTDSLLADGKQQKAVDVVKAAKQTASAELAVDLELLLGRVYSQWKGHTGDALTIYDALAESNPDDFRAPLAKGLILKSEGRKGDAARYFMKARYLAPSSARQAVDALVSRP